MRKKHQRKSGRMTTVVYDPVNCPYEFTYWDDWNDYRDGFRNCDDKTLLSKHPWAEEFDRRSVNLGVKNKTFDRMSKIKKHEKIRKAKKTRRKDERN